MTDPVSVEGKSDAELRAEMEMLGPFLNLARRQVELRARIAETEGELRETESRMKRFAAAQTEMRRRTMRRFDERRADGPR